MIVNFLSFKNTDGLLYEKFRKSYCELNNLDTEDFDRASHENYEGLGRNKLTQASEALIGAIKEAERMIAQNGFSFPHIVVFAGPGLMDGHALAIDGESYVFFDLSLISRHYEQESFEKLTHVLHETAHGIHYKKSPEFDRLSSFKRGGEHAFRMLISEGMACALSSYWLSKDGISHDPLWFKLIPSELLGEWEKFCESRMEDDLEEILSLKDGETPREEHFSVASFDRNDLIRGRRAYFHGFHLVQKAFQREERIEDLLNKDPQFWRKFCGLNMGHILKNGSKLSKVEE